MEYLTSEYFYQVECYHRMRYPDEDQEKFVREFRQAVMEDPSFRATLAFFMSDETKPHADNIRTSVRYYKMYMQDLQFLQEMREMRGGIVDDAADGEVGLDFEDTPEANDRPEMYRYSTLLRIAREEESAGPVVLPERWAPPASLPSYQDQLDEEGPMLNFNVNIPGDIELPVFMTSPAA